MSDKKKPQDEKISFGQSSKSTRLILHELWVDGHHLLEKRKTLIDGNDKTLLLVHIRSIDDKHYKEVTEADVPGSKVESNITKDEFKKFEEDWFNLWNPAITKNEIEKVFR